MWVVKLGGSLHDSASLRAWLRWLADDPGNGTIVVPGGGPFANAIRRLQPELGFDDLAAHRMAILAMQQYALHLHALEPRLALADGDDELRAGSTCLWLPWRLAGRAPGLPASWDVTSDSLALWLAVRLRAERLLLVKSGDVPSGAHPAANLVASGLIDPAFPTLLDGFTGEVTLVHRDEPPGGSGRCQVLPSAAATSESASSAETTARATR